MIEEVIGTVKLAYKSAKWLKEYYQKKKAKQVKDDTLGVIIVAEIGRAIASDVKNQLGEPFAVISYTKTLKPDEFNKVAGDVFKAIAKANTMLKGSKITLVLSGPVALNFILGQFVGVGHFDINLAYWSAGKYEITSAAIRDYMF